MSEIPAPQLCGGILVGGQSKRMGRPKHLLEFHGRTLLENAVLALRPHTPRVALLGSAVLPDPLPPMLSGLPRIPDAADIPGPLAGILAALRSKPAAAWIILACDLPHVSGLAVAWLLGQRRPDAVAALPALTPGQVEPLFALYEPAALPLLEEIARGPNAAPRLLASQPGVLTPTPPAELSACWRNVNTPSELESFEAVQ